jgi:hypothetical protein
VVLVGLFVVSWQSGSRVLAGSINIEDSPVNEATDAPEPTTTPEPAVGINVYVDYGAQQLEVTSDDNNEIMVCFPTVKETVQSGVTTIKSIKEKKWDYYTFPAVTTKSDGTSTKRKVSVPLAAVNPSKVTYVEIKGDVTETPVLLRFHAADSKLRAKYTAAESYGSDSMAEVLVTVGKKDEVDASRLEFRTTQGSWMEFDGVNVNYYTQRGADLYIREKAEKADMDTNEETGDTFLTGASHVTVSSTGDKYALYSAGSFAGTEVKVKIKKKSNAPSAQIKYSKDGFSVKKGCEYRFYTKNEKGVYEYSDWEEAEETFLSRPADSSSGVLEVRKSSESGKPSKIGFYEYGAFSQVTTSKTASEVTADTGILENSTINVYEDVKLTELQATLDKGVLKLKNLSSSEYCVLCVSDYLTDAKKLAELRSLSPTARVKSGGMLSLTKYKDKYLYVAYAANDKSKKWQSDYVLLGKVTTE